ncbi:MAG: prolyl oligopeptidase family serine peptidase [Promethearchaeota archaeon]
MAGEKLKKRVKVILKIFCYITLGIGIYWTIIMFYPLPPTQLSNAFAMGIAQVSGFLIILYLLTTLLLLKLTPKKKPKKIKRKEDTLPGEKLIGKNPTYKIVLIIGLSLAIINSLPLLSTPLAIDNAENEFARAYGDNWRDRIPAEVESYFLPCQFDMMHYFLGMPQKECRVDTNILYYKDDKVELYFDVYYPPKTNKELPGHNSTIIKIHGGGWTQGDKGIGDMLWVNKYLAAQGYIVFDIQYGLYKPEEESIVKLPTPEHVRSDKVNLHDMVFHIGYFTKQLESQLADRYHANLDSVFIMGGSAGGHLTCIVGYGYNDKYFAGNFSDTLTIKGVIPYYPAIRAERFASGSRDDLIPGTPESNPLAYEKFTPTNLIDKNDPSTIIFHGEQDNLVPIQESRDIKNKLRENDVRCLYLTFPTAAHANDYMANNNYQQVFLYYLERFLYLEQ